MTVTPETIAAAIPAAKPGDTLVLEGVFGGLPLKGRPANLTLDCRKATITGDTRTADLDGLTLIGGTWTAAAPISITRGRGLTMIEPVMRGPDARTGSAVTCVGVAGVKVLGAVISTYRNAVVLSEVDGFEVSGAFNDLGVDGVTLSACWNGWIHDLTVHGHRLLPEAHGDAVQIRSLRGKRPTANLRIEDVEITGDCAGVQTTLKTGDGGFDNITVRRLKTHTRETGCAMLGVRGLTLEDVQARTYPGALQLARVYVREDCTDVTLSRVGYAAYRNKRAAVLAA